MIKNDERVPQTVSEIDLAYAQYYDSASGEQLEEQRAWAKMVGPNLLIGVVWDGVMER